MSRNDGNIKSKAIATGWGQLVRASLWLPTHKDLHVCSKDAFTRRKHTTEANLWYVDKYNYYILSETSPTFASPLKFQEISSRPDGIWKEERFKRKTKENVKVAMILLYVRNMRGIL